MLLGDARNEEIDVFARVGQRIKHKDRELLEELLCRDSNLWVFESTELH